MAEQIREKRATESRKSFERPASWMAPSLLPDPNPEEGYVFRWIRVASLGKDDPTNISGKLREGWEPVKASDHPEIQLFGTSSEGRFPDSVEIGGLMLCKTPSEMVLDRNGFFQDQAASQMRSVDHNLMRENDPRMPLFNERTTKVTFGKGT